jgi:VanZ family protein
MVLAYRRLILAVYVVALFGVTLTPVPAPTYAGMGLDKLVHLGLFAGLAFLIHRNLDIKSGWIASAVAITLSVAAALMIEGLQDILPYRRSDLRDFAAGVVGAIIGVAVAALLLGGKDRLGQRPAKER